MKHSISTPKLSSIGKESPHKRSTSLAIPNRVSNSHIYMTKKQAEANRHCIQTLNTILAIIEQKRFEDSCMNEKLADGGNVCDRV